MENFENMFVPEYCIQGEEIPIYLIWDRDKEIRIKLTIPEGIKVKEIYNVLKEGLQYDDVSLLIKSFEVNGYFSIVLQSSCYKDPVVNKKIIIEIIENNVSTSIVKEIELFRPEIKIIDQPENIEIFVENNKQKIKNKIKVSNIGRGTAFISLKIEKDNEFRLSYPSAINEFFVQFWTTFEKESDSLVLKYPNSSEAIHALFLISKNSIVFDKEGISKLNDVYNKLSKVMEEDKSFSMDFIRVLVKSYLKNISIITEVNSFMIYLKSSWSGRILLYDPLQVFKITKDHIYTLNAQITITDLINNSYDPIPINKIQFKTNDDCEIPLYSIFDFIPSEDRED